ncbi:L-type lectin-domain containing protein [Chryseobacterium fistulae]|uniref:Pesticidal crystal protein Cry22Aa n=1 Tax=Chryseobacterium fistulae TaxID=2675058 RepID=A0A6N4XRW9_9FLAO|nr:L-type lectin-domain containing protein [Chryseobacterium fistulae]CAA7387590.1 Pesticidal crystal protein Cry22Aa [Chryseobacterium fistulae]
MKILQYNFLDPGLRSFCLTVSFMITVLIGRAEAQTLLTEGFNYSSGTLLTNAHWSQQSGGSPSVTVANGNLTYPNTISNNIGSKVSLSSSGQDVYHSFTSASLDASNPGVYSSLIVNVSQAQAIGDFFFALGASGPNASVYIRSNGIGFSFGVGKTAASAEYETTVRPFNTNIMLVLKYEFVTGAQNDEIKLYVNPSLASEPVTADIVTAPAIGDVGTLTYAFLYQGNASNAPTLEVDGINVGRSWASVTSAIFDYGDTPIGYDFTKDGVYVPAAHTVLTGLSLGSLLPSTELTAHSVADGADNNGTNGDGLEEDAIDISLNQIRKGVSYVLSVSVTNPSGTKYLYGWIDFNNDGKFQAEEFANISFSTSGSSTQTLTWTAVQTATIASGANKLYMRLRLSDRSLNDFTTVATGGTTLDERSIGSGATSTNDPTDYVTPANGEVEDYQIDVVNTYEYGDLPSSFENDKDSNPLPAMHAPLTGFTLGSLIDFESTPASVTSPSENNVAGDNAVGLADEDALTSLMSVNRGAPYSLSVPISIPSSLSGWKYLYGWLDLNGDGRFQAGEIATNNTTGNTSTNLTLTWTTAQTNQIASGTTKIYLRLRLSNLDLQDFTTVATGGATLDERSTGNGATSSANSVNAAITPFGEVEDYQLPVDLYDFGDVPISYDNDKDGNFIPAGHISLAGLSLGNIVPGVEQTPHSVAAGADNNGANGDGLEEDAIDVSLNQIRKGVSYVLSVPVVNTSGTKYLYGWIDFNNDGKFQVEEVATTSFGTTGSSIQTLTWPTFQTSTIATGATQLYMRLRLSDRFLNDFTTVATGGAILDERSIGNGATSTGDATNHVNPANGEVEDYQIDVVNTYEYGDLPASFENDKDSNPLPAMHAPLTGFTLGSLIDFESTPASVTSPNENNIAGDNTVGLADEDALTSLESVSHGVPFHLSVPVNIPSSLTGTKYLYGWLDLNGDGRFQAGEVATAIATTSGNVQLTWTAAQTNQIAFGTPSIYLRLRLSNLDLYDFTTVATGGATLDERSVGNGATSSSNSVNAAITPFGEVEDYQLPVDFYDYGDVPVSYDNDKDGNFVPAGHISLTGLSLGNIVPGVEPTPHSVAAGADNNGANGDGLEEDAIDVSLNQIRKGVSYVLNFPVANPSGTKYLYGWIDFNNDGKFQVEEVATNTFSTAGNSTQFLTWTAAQTTTIVAGANKLYMRLRLSDRSLNDFTTVATGGAILDERSIGNGATSTGNATNHPAPADGEVEDYQIDVVNTYEYGDAPASFENDKDNNPLPAAHAPLTGFTLGSLIDFEATPASVASPNENNTTGDNAVGSADEDALQPSIVSISRGMSSSISVPISIPSSLTGTKYLYGWLDLNGDGRFQVEEIATTSTSQTSNTHLTLTWTAAQTNQIPSGTTNIYLRLRLSDHSLQDFTTAASGGAILDERSIGNGATSTSNSMNASTTSFGEVEDYQLSVDLYDFGDVPSSYATSSSGFLPARQVASDLLKIGTTVDIEPTAQSVAAAADNNGINGDGLDEDGIDPSSFSVTPNTPFVLPVPVTNSIGSAAILHGWIDFNNDGKFQAGEHTSVNVPNGTNGTVTLNWTAAQTVNAVGAQRSYMSLRFVSGTLSNNAPASEADERSFADGLSSGAYSATSQNFGEVEDYQIEINTIYDFGDVPVSYDQPTGSLYAARHLPSSSLYLGATIPDTEYGPQSVSSNADNNGTNGDGLDEDGIDPTAHSISPTVAFTLPVSVNNTSGAARTLYGWLDVNNNGLFEIGERVSVTVPINATSVNLTWPSSVTGLIVSSHVYLRLRITTTSFSDNSSTPYDEGAIADGTNTGIYSTVPSIGEVEDYRLEVTNAIFDFGDAPNTYEINSSGAFVPARHKPESTLFLGNTFDTEISKQSVLSGSNNNGSNGDGSDEDGIITVPLPQLTYDMTSYSVDVNVFKTLTETATLHGWIDMDGDGHFSSFEHASTLVTGSSGAQTVTLTWPSPFYFGTDSHTTYLRLRLTTAAIADNTTTVFIDERSIGDGLSTGNYGITYINGEVEDYALSVPGYLDSDGDGIADNMDLDDDNDGIPDCIESGFSGDPTSAFKISHDANIPTDHLTGPAFQIQITPPAGSREGTAWSYGKIDFSKNFSFSMQVYLGAFSGGADGLAVVFQNSPNGYNAIGSVGAGLGAQGIANGIVLEMDTFMNPEVGDPAYDHGTIRRSSNWAALSGSAPLKADHATVKDGMWHEVTVNWSAAAKTLSYTFDENLVVTHTFPESGANSIIGILGSTQAYFGYTGSTGGAINDQRIGFDNPCLLPVFRDSDNDGIFDHLDLDSDNDGCLDALEGGDNVAIAMLVNSGGTVEAGTGSSASNQNLCATAACIDAQGVPLMVNPGGAADVDGLQGQGLGSSIDSLIQDALCLVTPFCYKPGATTGGITLDTKLGITSLGRAGADQADNWPMVRKGGWIALEAKAKGFVLNRVKFNTSNQPVADDGTTLIITTPVEGMMIYDTTNECLKMYTSTDGGTTFGWHCMETQTCPD